ARLSRWFFGAHAHALRLVLPIELRTRQQDAVFKGLKRGYHSTGTMSICYHGDMEKTRTTIRLEEPDRKAIAAIRAYYGLSSDNDAIRLALREVERAISQQSTPPKPQTRKSHSSPPEKDCLLPTFYKPIL